jgi:transposase
VAELLGVSDIRLWRTLDHYVDQARGAEDFSTVTAIGFDETTARRGHHHVSLFHDLDAARLLFACEGRKAEVVAQFADDLEAHGGCAENVHNVCIDMSASYCAGVDEQLPWAAVTSDMFHVVQLVSKAVDEVRRHEVESAPALRRSRYLWRKDKGASSARQISHFVDLKRLNLKAHRAFRIK